MKYVMQTLTTLLFLGALLIPAGAASAQASGQHWNHQKDHKHRAHAEAADAVQAKVVDGVQVAEVKVGPMGYTVERVAFKAGIPARLVFTRTEDGGCTQEVKIPELGVEATKLPIGEPVAFEFTPEKAAEFSFLCGMDMVKGMVVVRGS